MIRSIKAALRAGFVGYDSTVLGGLLAEIDMRAVARQIQSLDTSLARDALCAYSEIASDTAFDPMPAPSKEPGALRESVTLTPLAFLGWLIFVLSIALHTSDQLEGAKLLHLPMRQLDPMIGAALVCADKLIEWHQRNL
jgi:hypothetical protein